MDNFKKENQFDVIVIGAGLVGLSFAYHLKLKHPIRRVLVLEKEAHVAAHQSGHNSGVIHSGIYYKPGSLKAKNCIEGYHSLIEFARKYDIPHDISGKVIVASSDAEIPALDMIHQRGVDNGLRGLKKLTREELREIEPHVEGRQALWVPQAGIIDFPLVAERLRALFENELGGTVVFNGEVKTIHEDSKGVSVETDAHTYRASYVVSCAGLQSDRVTAMVDSSNDLRIIPFKGIYYKLRPEKEYLVNNLVYPVPDPKFPFLGVHFTRMIGGGVEAGPNAVLSLKREGYEPFSFSGRDSLDTFTWPGFWRIAAKYGRTGAGEIYRSVSKKAFTRALRKLIPEIQEADLVPGGAGVRAQACTRDGLLVDDFDFKFGGRTMHVRNAPSPAATSCLSIGNSLVQHVEKLYRP